LADEKTWCCERCREAALGRRHSIANLQTEEAARSRVLAPTAGSRKPMSRLVQLASMPAGLLSAFAHRATTPGGQEQEPRTFLIVTGVTRFGDQRRRSAVVASMAPCMRAKLDPTGSVDE